MKTEEGRLSLHGARGLEQALPLLPVDPSPLDESDAVAARGEPAGIDPRSTAHVEHGAGRRRQVAQDDLLRAGELDEAVAAGQTPGLTPRS